MNMRLNICMLLYLVICEVHILLEWFINGSYWPKLALRLSSGHFLLIEAKHELIIDGYITSCMPMAVGKAIVWAKETGFVMFKSLL